MIRNQLARVSKNQKSGTSGLQLPQAGKPPFDWQDAIKFSGSSRTDFVHSITDPGYPVNTVGMVDQTASRQFKEWFGKSKVVDENGKPLVVYRGSPYDPLSQESGKGVIKPEAYFTADPEYAKRYTGNGGKVRAYYLSISQIVGTDPAAVQDNCSLIVNLMCFILVSVF